MIRGPRALTLLLILSVALSLASVIYPLYVIRPFRSQGPRELLFALAVIRWRPLITVACALAAVTAAAANWSRPPERRRRSWFIVAAFAACALVLLARVNVYELMFHPDERPSFLPAMGSKLAPDEKVIAIRLGNEARAYPVRSVSYHHVINDEVDKRAIVATY